MVNEGMNNNTVAQKTGFCFATVSQWRRRFIEQGFEGLYDEPRPRWSSINQGRANRPAHKTLKNQTQEWLPLELPFDC